MGPGGGGGTLSPAWWPPRRRRWPLDSLLLFLALLLLLHSSEEEKEGDAASNLLSDVCATCHANATCQQIDGKNACVCNYGFVGNGRTYCQDKDECQIGTEKICGDHTSCHNTYGSFYCVCLEGFQASSKNKIFIPNDGTNCIDINECEVSDICGLGGRCLNTAGSYECYCMEGYQIENGSEPFHSLTTNISCKEIDCGKPPEVQNTEIIWDNTTTFGSTVYYKCKDGFQHLGERNFSQCTVAQKWESITFECKEITCGQPPIISHSKRIWNGLSRLGSVVEFTCIKGFYPAGTKRRSFCTRSGTWEFLDLRCEKVEEFADVALNESCLTWRRRYGSAGINETYQLSMRMLGSESNTTTDILINPPAREETVNVCLQLHQDTNYSVEITARFARLILMLKIIHPVVEKKVEFSNITLVNGTCIKWWRESGTAQAEETYVIHVQGLRWYQEQFHHELILNFTTDSQTPEVCFNFLPGSNYSVNVSTINLDHNVVVSTKTEINDPEPPKVEFISVQGFVPLLRLRKAEEKNGPISSYQAVVIPWSSQCNFNCYSSTNVTYFSKGSDSESYVAAEFPAQAIGDGTLEFAPGDRLYYGKYYNAPLKQGRDYCIIVRTISEWDEVRTQSCVAWAQIKDLSSPPQHLTVVVLGSVAACCSILLLLLCVACSPCISS
ncbi:sushi domain-containing protein 1 isoform X2 [Pogona vitticeps]